GFRIASLRPTSGSSAPTRVGSSSISSCGSIAISGPNSSIRRWRSFWGSRAFDLDKLMAEQAKTSRSTAAFVGRNLRLSGLRAGDPRPADPALHGSEWIVRYAQKDGHFDEASARRELVRQLGAEWK